MQASRLHWPRPRKVGLVFNQELRWHRCYRFVKWVRLRVVAAAVLLVFRSSPSISFSFFLSLSRSPCRFCRRREKGDGKEAFEIAVRLVFRLLHFAARCIALLFRLFRHTPHTHAFPISLFLCSPSPTSADLFTQSLTRIPSQRKRNELV